MVFTSAGPTVYKVLDGQQRLATTIMLFSAVRNWLSGYSNFSKELHQVEDYLSTSELGSKTPEPRLTLTTANNEAFQTFATNSQPLAQMDKALKTKAVNNRSETLIKAVIDVNRYVQSKADSFSSPETARDYFISLLTFISHNVEIVRFSLSSDAAAYTIFETLNDRGLELAPLDLVKNHLFSQAEKHRVGSLAEYEARWTEMMTLLSSSRADSFLRAFWISRYAKHEGAKLFGFFKRAYPNPDTLHNLSVDLRRDAQNYAALFSSNDAIWSGYSAKAKSSIDALGVMGFTQAYPVILSALSKFSRTEMERLLWLIECAAVRHQLIGKGRPGRVESLCGRAAKDIFEGRLTTTSGVFGIIRELYVPDADFRSKFEVHEESSPKKARYLLNGLEREVVKRDSAALNDELTAHAVTVEHIFPRKPDETWESISEQDQEWDDRLINRLGNLCLLPGINHALGNKGFPHKQSVYARSQLRLTASVAECEQWGRTEILARQQAMAKIATSAWHFQ